MGKVDIRPDSQMKLLFIGIFVLLTFAISGVFYGQSKPKDSIQTSITKEAMSGDIPPLFSEVSWEEFEESEGNKSLGERGLYVQGDEYGFIHMNGEEWSASKSNISRESMDELLTSFQSYYDNELTKLGWGNIYENTKYSFVPSSGDGPGGWIKGYIKVKDDNLREILLLLIIPVEDFGGRAKCPCDVGFRVFISEEVPLDELLKRIEKE